VQTAIFSPYGGGLLDVRRAVLIDGTDHGGRMLIMTAAEWEKVLAAFDGNADALADRLGFKFDLYDGRVLWS
jgi:hypothetical protein